MRLNADKIPLKTANNLQVKVKGTRVGTTASSAVSSITSGDKSWPALSNIPIISIDFLEFCNYTGPDSFMTIPSACATDQVIEDLADKRANLINAELCFRDEVKLQKPTDADYVLIASDGCADHATFKDVRSADATTCSGQKSKKTSKDGESWCGDASACAMECVNQCGDALSKDACGEPTKACCIDACGKPEYLDQCGYPSLDACGTDDLPPRVSPCLMRCSVC